MEIKYRPEIDGLRTVAVAAVIIYHAEFSVAGHKLLPGGFFGVDVFFVISGFLITSLVMTEFHNTGTISISNFYQRRARRLVPALLAVMLVSLPFAWIWLLPDQLIDYAKSLISSVFFGSNFYWNYSLQQYGAESGLLKPFLHTWSLAVEEQYYIVYPLMLLAIYKWCRSYVLVLLLGGLLLSLQYAEWMTARDSSFSFYMLPTRFWELLAGGLLAHIIQMRAGKDNHSLLNRTMPVLGIIFIVYAMFFVDFNDARHPGYITLFPVAGSILLIYFANKNEFVTKLLCSKLFVGIGLISYSLYLWHYPIFAFGRMVSSSNDVVVKAIWIALTLLASTASYYLVERPLRNKQLTGNKRFWIIVSSMLFIICSASLYFMVSSGGAHRMDGNKAYSEFREPEFSRLEGSPGVSTDLKTISVKCFNRDPLQACHFGDGLFVTLGDSYAAQYEAALLEKLKSSGHGLINLTAGLCPFVKASMRFADLGYLCPAINTRRWQVVASFETKKIFVISTKVALFSKVRGGPWMLDDAWKDYISSIEELLNRGHKVVLLTGAPGGDDVIVQKWKIDALKKPFTTRSTPVFHPDKNLYAQWQASHAPQFQLVHENLIQVRVADLFCPESTGRQCLIIAEDGSYYNTGSHVSSIGADRILEHVFSEMKKQAWID